MEHQLRIGILGAGPAGLGAALRLAERGIAPTLVEKSSEVGGNAGSFDLGGVKVDYGSHRLHPATDPDILDFLRARLGSDLVERPRHGRIFLKGRWIHFPLRPLDLALRAHPRFVWGVLSDLAASLAPRRRSDQASSQGEETFATVLEGSLGPTICQEFYFPFARKIWGLDPGEISPAQADKRVSARSLTSLLRRLLPGGTGAGGRRARGTFYYPRGGFGRISEVILEEAEAAGARTLLGAAVRRVRLSPGGPEVEVKEEEGVRTLSFDHLWSTIPVGPLVRMVDPPPPPEVLQSAEKLHQRAVVLVYLLLERTRFTEFDAHYIPTPLVPFSRLSEPKNYSGVEEPENRTVLCAEIPCSVGDSVWMLSEPELGTMLREGLDAVGLPVRSPVLGVAVRRLPSAYPIFHVGYETHLSRIEEWLDSRTGLVSFGRQGLFTHDNTHHALHTAWSAVKCLRDDGTFDRHRWARLRQGFASHVVED